MNDIVLIIFLILICILALVFLPKYFLKKNGRSASQQNYEAYVENLLSLDKQLAPHTQDLAKSLKVINYWLKTGYDPTAEESEEEKNHRLSQAKRYERGEMTPTEADEYRQNRNKSKANFDIIDINEKVKMKRKKEFSVDNLDPCDIGIDSMDFVYDDSFIEHIYYSPTQEALKKKYYKNIIYFTTARPGQIPMTYPNKYDGAQMLSLYKHPSQAVWFLKNWKAIRDAMETKKVTDIPEELEDVTTEFDL